MNFMTKNAVVPKLMIVGAGVLQLPAIQKAKSLGLDVAVIEMLLVFVMLINFMKLVPMI